MADTPEKWDWVSERIGQTDKFICLKDGKDYILGARCSPENETYIAVSSEHAAIIAAAPETAAERDRLKEVNAGLLAALKEFDKLRPAFRAWQVGNRIPGWQNDDKIFEQAHAAIKQAEATP